MRPSLLRRWSVQAATLTFSVATLSGTPASPPSSGPSPAFDAHLEVELLGILPPGAGRPVALEAGRFGPLVATEAGFHSLAADRWLSVSAADDRPSSLALDADGRTWWTAGAAVYAADASGPGADPALTALTPLRIFGSGEATIGLERASADGESAILLALPGGGTALGVVRVPGPLAAAGWNDEGLAAVAGDTLYLWNSGGRRLDVLARSNLLRTAKAVAAVGPRRAVVALDRAVALVTPDEGPRLLVGMSALVSFREGTLYLLDLVHRGLWRVAGVKELELLNKVSDRPAATVGAGSRRSIVLYPAGAVSDLGTLLEVVRHHEGGGGQ